jgi:ubiquinone/menaquinone biosynthesis C-methylase UbiE
MSDWAEWLVANGQADAATVAEAERVIEAASLEQGDTVLDLGSGLGLLTFAAHERIGDGWVIAIDPSVGALEELLRLAHEAHASGIMYLVGDAEVLPLPDASVDAALLRSVLTHVADIDAAAQELGRVLRPGGRLSLREPLNRDSTFISNGVDWSPLGEDVTGRMHAWWSETAASDPLQQLDADALAGSLRDAGFVDVTPAVEDPGDEWAVDEGSVDRRLDARGAPDAPSLRERWHDAFGPAEADRLAAHLRSLAGTTVTFRRPQLFLSARRG